MRALKNLIVCREGDLPRSHAVPRQPQCASSSLPGTQSGGAAGKSTAVVGFRVGWPLQKPARFRSSRFSVTRDQGLTRPAAEPCGFLENPRPSARRLQAHRPVIATRRELEQKLGSTWAARNSIASGEWVRFLPGVFIARDFVREPRARIRAALKWAPGAVASHRTAAVLHGLDLAFDKLELSVAHQQRIESHALVQVHRARLPRTARTKVQGLACTTVTRTLFDLAGCVSFIDLAIAVEAAWRRDARVLRRLRNALGARGHRGRGGVYALRTVADDCESRRKPLRSALEVRMWWLLHALDHPLPVPGYRFSDAEGNLEIDFAFPDQMVAVETDGRRFHGPDRFVPDARRQARLVAAGWRVPRFTFVDVVFHPEVVLTRVSAALTFGPGNPAASVEELATMTLEDPVVQPLQIPACDELYDWHGEERTR